MKESILRTSNLTKAYHGVTVLSDVSVTLEAGRIYGLIGKNGAGKTTTIKMLSCLIKPTKGDGIVLGESIVKNPLAVKKKINVSPQETAVAPNLTVRENLETIAGLYGSKRKEAVKKADHSWRNLKCRKSPNKGLNPYRVAGSED